MRLHFSLLAVLVTSVVACGDDTTGDDAGVEGCAPGEAGADCTPCDVGYYCAGGDDPAVECSAGTWDHDVDPSTECEAHADCAAGEYVAADGTTIADRDCTACAANTFSTIANATSCTAWTDCVAGEYVAAAGTATSDRMCTACSSGDYSDTANASSCTTWTQCLAGEYVSTAGSVTNDQSCSTCAVGDYSNTANAGACTSWTDCVAGEYIAAAGTTTTDRVCTACSSGEFSDTTNASSCTTWAQCVAGQYISTTGSATNDQVCSTCAAGSYSDTANAGACTLWTQCIAGEYVSTAGSVTNDQSCSTCAVGSFSNTANASACVLWTDCVAGEYVLVAGSPTADRSCSACPAGEFSDTTNAPSCTTWTVCVPPEVELAAPSDTNDRECGDGESCLQIYTAAPTLPSGLYDIVIDFGLPTETPLTVWCDMDRDGGGWTLVLQNNSAVVNPAPSFADVVSATNTTGTYGADQTQFDLFLGVDYWNRLGTQIRMEMGPSVNAPIQQVIYNFAIDYNNNYALGLTTGSITIGGADTDFRPGGYHDGMGLSTFDVDNDNHTTGACGTLYNNAAWWYNVCWTESWWGNSSPSGPYWAGYHNWGALWLR